MDCLTEYRERIAAAPRKVVKQTGLKLVPPEALSPSMRIFNDALGKPVVLPDDAAGRDLSIRLLLVSFVLTPSRPYVEKDKDKPANAWKLDVKSGYDDGQIAWLESDTAVDLAIDCLMSSVSRLRQAASTPFGSYTGKVPNSAIPLPCLRSEFDMSEGPASGYVSSGSLGSSFPDSYAGGAGAMNHANLLARQLLIDDVATTVRNDLATHGPVWSFVASRNADAAAAFEEAAKIKVRTEIPHEVPSRLRTLHLPVGDGTYIQVTPLGALPVIATVNDRIGKAKARSWEARTAWLENHERDPTSVDPLSTIFHSYEEFGVGGANPQNAGTVLSRLQGSLYCLNGLPFMARPPGGLRGSIARAVEARTSLKYPDRRTIAAIERLSSPDTRNVYKVRDALSRLTYSVVSDVLRLHRHQDAVVDTMKADGIDPFSVFRREEASILVDGWSSALPEVRSEFTERVRLRILEAVDFPFEGQDDRERIVASVEQFFTISEETA